MTNKRSRLELTWMGKENLHRVAPATEQEDPCRHLRRHQTASTMDPAP